MGQLHQKPCNIPETVTATALGARVILFNDDMHTFEEVTGQLARALSCPADEAFRLAYLAHTNGSAVVFAGPVDQCLGVSSVLEEIHLLTRIECE